MRSSEMDPGKKEQRGGDFWKGFKEGNAKTRPERVCEGGASWSTGAPSPIN